MPMDWTINFGNLLQVAMLLSGIAAFWYAIRNDINVLTYDVKHIKEQQKALSEAFTQLGKVLTQVAVQDNRMAMMEKDIDEMRHGIGFISPK